MTVTTTASPASRPRSWRSMANMAMRWSPSTSPPVSSTARTRSASPSKARPTSGTELDHRDGELGGVGRAAPRVDVAAVGVGVEHLDLGAEPAQPVGGGGRRRAVGAVDDDVQPIERRPSSDATASSSQARLPGAGVVGRRRPAGGPADPTESSPSSRTRARSSTSSVSLRPPAAKNLMPLSDERVVRGGDHGAGHARASAQTQATAAWAPRRALDVRALRGQPARQRRLEPARTRAVSRPMHEPRPRSRAPSPRARPSAATSASVSSSARPRTPSVPKRSVMVRKPRRAPPRRGRARRDELELGHRQAGPDQRLEYCGALRAFLRPYFLLSFLRASRVRNPAFLSSARSSGSRSTSARAMPWRRAPAWPDGPPPSMRARRCRRLGGVGEPQRLGEDHAVGLGREVVGHRRAC